jgi:PAS domain S-box-containing protein
MNERKRFLSLILIMTCVSLVVGGIAITLLYRAALNETRQRLVETAQSQARLIEAVARFDRTWSAGYPEGWVSATLSQMIDAHERVGGFGETGEFTLGRREEGNVVFLLSHRHADLDSPKPLPFESELAEPMRRALLGQSGTVIGPDYRGTRVVAAYEPVAELDLGIVAKIDIAEVRAPFIRAGLWAAGSALLVILLGSALFLRVSNPILKRFQDLYEKSQHELAERKRAEEASAESEQRFRQLAEHIQEVFWLGTPDWQEVIYVSPAYESLWGRTCESLYREPFSWLDAVAEQDRERVLEVIDRRAAGEVAEAAFPEYRVVRPDGSFRWVLARAFPIRNERGDIYRIAGIAEDISDRKLAEEALRNAKEQLERRVHERTAELAAANEDLRREIEERSRTEVALRASEATFTAVFKSAPVMMLLLDENRTVRAANPAATSVSANWDEQAVERRFGDAVQCVHSLDSPEGCGFGSHCARCPVRLLVKQTFETGEACQTQEVRLTRTVGDEVQDAHYLMSTALLEIPDRREILVCLEDITEQKQAADRIRTSLKIQQATNAILQLAMESPSREEFLARVLDLIVSIPWLALESKGCIFLVGEDRKALEMVAQRDLPPEVLTACGTLPFGKCLCGQAAVTGDLVFASGVDDRHEVRYPGMSPHGHYCVPIASKQRLMGILSLYLAAGHKRKSEEETFLSSVANILAIALQRKEAEDSVRQKEAQLIAAAEIQKALLPEESVALPGFSIAGRCYPAEFAAGDHFNYLWLPDGSLLVVLGDVSGHGVGPAIVTAAFRTRFEALAEQLSDPAEMAAKVNASLHKSTSGEIFVTLLAARIDPQSRTLTYVNAGHPPGLVLDSSGAVKARLETKTMPLAILPDLDFIPGGPVQLAAGDMMLFFTDGLVEAQTLRGPMFGVERVVQTLRENRDKTPTAIIEALYTAVCRYIETERLRDDVTMVVVKVEPTEEEESLELGRAITAVEEGD